MNTKYIWTLAKNYGLKVSLRRIPYIASAILSPLALLLIFVLISSGSLLPFAITGGLIVMVAEAGLFVIADGAHLNLYRKFKDMIMVTKVTQNDYMFGLMLCELCFLLPGVVFYILLSILCHTYSPLSAAISFLVLVALWLAVGSISFFFSLLPDNQKDVWGYTSILMVLFTLIVPIYYPYTLLPKPIFYAMLLVPTTSAAVIIQGAIGLVPASALAPYILLIETVVFFLIAYRFSRWKAV